LEEKYKRERNIYGLASSSNTSSAEKEEEEEEEDIFASMRFSRTGLEGNPDFLAR
jgi:hypothetical protein